MKGAATKKCVMLLVMMCVAGWAGADEPLLATSPAGTLRQLTRAYEHKSVASLDALLTGDYRYHTSDARISVYTAGTHREGELKVAKNIFAGRMFGRKGEPKYIQVKLNVGNITEGADPEHPDSTDHYQLVVCDKLDMAIAVDDKPAMSTEPAQHVFHVVRGDAAVLAPGQAASADRWYIRRWLDNVSAVSTSLAQSKGDCGEGATATALLTPGPGVLAVRALNNPACPALEVMCDVPGTEPVHVDVFDVTGRLSNQREIAVKNAGALKVEAGAGAHLSPGVYWVRLRQAKLKPSTRMVVVAK